MTAPERETAESLWRDYESDVTTAVDLTAAVKFMRAIEAALLAAKAEEREACAAWCETQADFKGDLNDGINGEIYRHCAWAIRARGAPAAVKEEQGS